MKISAHHIQRGHQNGMLSDSLKRLFRIYEHTKTPSAVTVRQDALGDADKETLLDLLAFLESFGNDFKREARVVKCVLDAHGGDFSKTMPSYEALYGVLKRYLQKDLLNGWVFMPEEGTINPYLASHIRLSYYDQKREEDDMRVSLSLVAYGLSTAEAGKSSFQIKKEISFAPGSVSRRTIESVLESYGIQRETPELIAQHASDMCLFEATKTKFARQMTFTGTPVVSEMHGWRNESARSNRVIFDMDAKAYGKPPEAYPSFLCCEAEDTLSCPVLPYVRVFDLKTYEFLIVHVSDLKDYVYDASLRNKLILPPTHSRLLDVMTDSAILLGDDLIEGKKAPRIIVARGRPGLGKTLTAEAYSEIMSTPLYAIHSGHFGTTPAQIEKALSLVFARAKRWNCFILLDECDVFVSKRETGMSLEQNAVVAVFLRMLEYYDGVMFMTTNRSGAIDDAILSRAAGIISYDTLSDDDRARVWQVQSDNFKAGLDADLISALVKAFPKASGRDIRSLLTTVMRVSAHYGTPIDLQVFLDYAVFKEIEIVTP